MIDINIYSHTGIRTQSEKIAKKWNILTVEKGARTRKYYIYTFTYTYIDMHVYI